jgi:hypothetical protein
MGVMAKEVELEDIEVVVTKEDVDAVDTSKLFKALSQSSYMVLAALVKQASKEVGRVAEFDEMISKSQNHLYSDAIFSNLKNEEHLKLLDIVAKNKKNSLAHLNKVHENTSKGMEAVVMLENHKQSSDKSVRRLITDESRANNKEMKLMIQSLIEEKLEQQKLLEEDAGK